MRIFFSVGEPSGDLHGSNLIRELHARDPDIECVGYGGPKMQAAGCQLHEDLTQLAVMWLLNVLTNIHKFWKLYRQADEYFRDNKVDAVVLIDFPGFNWWIASSAKRHGIPVFYYGVPQMWAWAGWRIRKMRRLVDHALCKLPFEAKWYQERGCDATYVGHPYFDELEQQGLDVQFVEALAADPRPIVTILPGSRGQEVASNLRWFIKAAQLVRQQVPEVRFAIASFNERQAEAARRECEAAKLEAEVHVGRTPELIHLSFCCMACSGSVSLELLYHLKPSVILYQIHRIGWFMQGIFRKVKYITLVNLLSTRDIRGTGFQIYDPDARDAEKVPFPEYLTATDKSEQIAGHVIEWLTDERKRADRIAQLFALKDSFCRGGASHSAANYLCEQLGILACDTPQTLRAA